MTKVKVLVTGSLGMLGKDIVSIFNKEEQFEIYAIVRKFKNDSNIGINYIECDITDRILLESILNKIKPQIIIHVAGIVNLSFCENNKELTDRTHIDATRQLANFKARFIYISTDSVFNGKSGNYTEDAIPDPLNYYARSKYLGELAALNSNSSSLIIRTNIFGFNKPLKGSLVEWALTKFENKEIIDGYKNIHFNAIYTYQLAEIILLIINEFGNLNGILNIGSKNNNSKYEFLCELAKIFNFDSNLVRAVNSPNNTFISRPLNTTLNINRATDLFKLPYISDGISLLKQQYINLENHE